MTLVLRILRKSMRQIMAVVVIIALFSFLAPVPTVAVKNETERRTTITAGCECEGCNGEEQVQRQPVKWEAGEIDRALPTSSDNSGSRYLPPVVDQIGSSCTAYSAVYTQFSYEANRLLNRSGASATAQFSPLFVYNTLAKSTQADPDELSGIGVDAAYDFIMEHGSLTCSYFPSTNANYDRLPTVNSTTENKLREALNIRVSDVNTEVIDTTNASITSASSTMLNSIKQLLSQGHILRATSQFNFNAGGSNSHIAYRCFQETNTNEHSTHSVVIVGYDDTFYYDINGNGSRQAAEYGALKVLNSWGNDYGQNGYVYVMYDALNKVSAVSGTWQNNLEGIRVSAFSEHLLPSSSTGVDRTGKNEFDSITVEEYEPLVIFGINCNTQYQDGLTVELGTATSRRITEYDRTGQHVERDLCMMFDMSDFVNVAGTIKSGMSYGVRMVRNSGAITDIELALIDSEGVSLLANAPTMSDITSGSRTVTGTVTRPLGDVSYNGSLNTADASMVLSYCGGQTEFSNLRIMLADYNEDGVVNTADATAILQNC